MANHSSTSSSNHTSHDANPSAPTPAQRASLVHTRRIFLVPSAHARRLSLQTPRPPAAMAPATAPPPSTLRQAESEITLVIGSLYTLTLQAHSWSGAQTSTAMRHEIQALTRRLQALSHTARAVDQSFPQRILQFVEEGRNPDILTRQYVEGVQEKNQQLKGRSEAFARFADELAQQMREGLPELEGDVARVLGSVRDSG